MENLLLLCVPILKHITVCFENCHSTLEVVQLYSVQIEFYISKYAIELYQSDDAYKLYIVLYIMFMNVLYFFFI